MQYADRDTKKNRLYAALATLFYVVFWVVLILFVTFKINVREDMGEGILINFGSTETGFGADDLPNSDELADAARSQQSAAEQNPAEQMTQQIEEAPAVVPTPNTTQPTTTQPTPARTTPAEEQPVEQPREVDQRALFPGRSDSNATSEGTSGGPGNQGDLAGDPTGSHAGTGTGNSGHSFNLSGRSLVGALPRPDYPVREEGRIIIEVRVNQQGNVESASFRSVGSTTTNSSLVNAALAAARKARFNDVGESASLQVGTITYNFRMQ